MNHFQDAFVCPFITTKGNEWSLPSASTPVVIYKQPLYFLYNCAPSIQGVADNMRNLQWTIQKPKIHDDIEPIEQIHVHKDQDNTHLWNPDCLF